MEEAKERQVGTARRKKNRRERNNNSNRFSYFNFRNILFHELCWILFISEYVFFRSMDKKKAKIRVRLVKKKKKKYVEVRRVLLRKPRRPVMDNKFVLVYPLQLWQYVVFFSIFSDISERNNDYSDNLGFKRRRVGEGEVKFFVLEVPDNKYAMLIYLYIYISMVTYLTCLTNILKNFQESDLKICPTLVLGTYAMCVFALLVK